MKRINRWKTLALAIIVPLLVTLHPVITHACNPVGSHGGC